MDLAELCSSYLGSLIQLQPDVNWGLQLSEDSVTWLRILRLLVRWELSWSLWTRVTTHSLSVYLGLLSSWWLKFERKVSQDWTFHEVQAEALMFFLWTSLENSRILLLPWSHGQTNHQVQPRFQRRVIRCPLLVGTFYLVEEHVGWRIFWKIYSAKFIFIL